MSRFTPNPGGIEAVSSQLAARLQEVFQEVAEEFAGRPEEEVYQELVTRGVAALAAMGAGYEPGGDVLQIARDISKAKPAADDSETPPPPKEG